MSSIFEDMNVIAELAGLTIRKPIDQDVTDYTLIMDALGDMSEISTKVLTNVAIEILKELGDREGRNE